MARRAGWHRFPDGVLPSDYFRSNVFISFQEDALAIEMRETIGVENLVWGSDYPHHETTFPHSLKVLDDVFAGVPDEQRRQILARTCDRHAEPVEERVLGPGHGAVGNLACRERARPACEIAGGSKIGLAC